MALYKGDKVVTCYATCSIGHQESHNLPAKLKAIADAGFESVELSMPDILAYGAELRSGREIDPKDYDGLVEVGKEIKNLMVLNKLAISMLQPFANFEGWPRGSKEREDAFDRARGWMRIMDAVGTTMLQIGSSDSPGISSDIDDLAADLAELADEMQSKGYRIAYENWCWATHAPDWKDVWQIVQKVNRANVGLCLDTFQSAGGEWADPTTASGLREDLDNNNASANRKEAIEKAWQTSLADLTRTVDPTKIFIFQISDGYRMTDTSKGPIKPQPDDSGLRPRGQWSHDYRPLPYDGGYLPVVDFTRAVMETGFRGCLSIEVFDGRASEKYTDDMTPYARRAMESLTRLLKEAASSTDAI